MKAKQKEYTAKLIQDGTLVIEVFAPTKQQVEQEIQHYALMYRQDGEIEIIRNYEI